MRTDARPGAIDSQPWHGLPAISGLTAVVGGAFGLLIALHTEVTRGGAGVTIAGLLLGILAVRAIENGVGKLRLAHMAAYAVTLFVVAILAVVAIPGRAPT